MASNFLTDTAVVVVVLGVMIFVHELGHFMAAKWFGIRVLTFSFGLGKRLFGFKPQFVLSGPPRFTLPGGHAARRAEERDYTLRELRAL